MRKGVAIFAYSVVLLLCLWITTNFKVSYEVAGSSDTTREPSEEAVKWKSLKAALAEKDSLLLNVKLENEQLKRKIGAAGDSTAALSSGAVVDDSKPPLVFFTCRKREDMQFLSVSLRNMLRQIDSEKLNVLLVATEKCEQYIRLLHADMGCFKAHIEVHICSEMSVHSWEKISSYSIAIHVPNGITRNYSEMSAGLPLVFGGAECPECGLEGCDTDAKARKPIPQLQARNEIPELLEKEGHEIGAEVGVKWGNFAAHLLSHWKACKEYLLIDLWAKQENYKDVANVDNAEQDKYYQTTLDNTDKWKDKRKVCRNFSMVCATHIKDGYLDYVYLDARHDYLGVTDDMWSYWPKVKKGGVFAGHDFIYASQVSHGQNWSTNYDGTINHGAVRGAVEEFARTFHRDIMVTVDGTFGKLYQSWLIRK